MRSTKLQERDALDRIAATRRLRERRLFGLDSERLILDVEITKSLYEFYSTGERYVGGRDLVKAGGINAMSYGWYPDGEIRVMTTYKDDYEAIILKAHSLLSKADFVIGHNFRRYDLPKLNDAFARMGLTFPEVDIVDTLTIARHAFGKVLPSGLALKDIVQYFGIGEPVARYNLLIEGLEAGDKAAIAKLYDYSRHDIVLTKALYEFLVERITGNAP